MRSIFAKIRKKYSKRYCYGTSAFGFAGAFLFMMLLAESSIGFSTQIEVITIICFFIISIAFLFAGIVFLLAGLHDVKPEPLRFYTVNQDGKPVLADVDTILAKPSVDCTETCRADGKVDVSMEIHSKEQAVEVLAALAVMYDKGDISSADYHNNVHKIREHFNL